MANNVHVQLHRITPTQARAVITLRLPDGKKVTRAHASSSPAKALAGAAVLAAKVAQDPLLAAVMPPGTGAAIKATAMLAKAAHVGKLGEVMKGLKGDGARRIASKLISWL
jgi:hypothetical protein